MHHPSKGSTQPVHTSFASLLRIDTSRVVRTPSRDEFPPEVGVVVHPTSQIETPAVVGVSGVYGGIGKNKAGQTGHQWHVAFYPITDRVRQRAAGQDVVDAIEALNRSLTARHPTRGATYTAYFAVPRHGEANVLDVSFRGTLKPGEGDPWRTDDKVAEEIRALIDSLLRPKLELLWHAWSKDPQIAEALLAQGIPAAAHSNTRFLREQIDATIRGALPASLHATAFPGLVERAVDHENPANPNLLPNGLSDPADDTWRSGGAIAVAIILGTLALAALIFAVTS